MKKTVAIIAGIFVSYNCYAANPYVGIGVGQSKAQDSGSCSDVGALFDPGYSCSIDDTGTSYNIFAGYNFIPNLSAEVGYVDLGKYNISASGTIGGTPSSLSGEFKAKGWTLSAVGSFPIQPNFFLLGRLGMFNWDFDLSASGTGALTGGGSLSSSGTDPLYGVGVQWDINNQFSVRGEWTRYQNVGDQNTTGQSDIDNLSVSAVYNF